MRRASVMHHQAWVSVLLAGCLASCAYEAADVSTTDQAIAGDGLNGRNLNGRNLNGTGYGTAIAWASFANVKVGAVHLDDVWLDGSQLVGMRMRGRQWGLVSGDEFEGATFEARSDTNREVKLRIADVIAPDRDDDVWHYAIEFKFQSRWIPMCLADALTGEGLNGPLLNGDSLNQALESGEDISLPSIPVDGYWNYEQGVPGGGAKIESTTRFTFACPQIGAIGKCVDAGYEPWAAGVDGAPLDAEHEACVRVMRADYCGDGTPHTVNGTLINIYDSAGVQDDSEPWGLEAEWDGDGARCITSHVRQAQPIGCIDRLYDDGCGAPVAWDEGTLLVSEIP
jgi:hypothetical protein